MTEVFKVGDKIIECHEIPVLLTRYQLMPQFLRGIILDRATADITCTEEERQNALKLFCQQRQLPSEQALLSWLQSQGLTLQQLDEQLLRPLLIDKFKTATFSPKVESYFLKRKGSLDQVVYSLIRTQDPGLAHELYYRVQEGEQSFAELAREYSQGPESRTGGLLGPVPLSQPHPAIAKLLSVSQPGQLWPPRVLAEWFVVIRLEKFIPAKLDESTRRQMIDELFETWLQEEVQKVKQVQPEKSPSAAEAPTPSVR